MNLKLTLLAAGLVIGAALGYVTAPKPAVDIQAGPVSLTVGGGGNSGSMTVTGKDGGLQVEVGDGSPLNDPGLRTAIFAAVFAVVGLGIGYVVEMRKG